METGQCTILDYPLDGRPTLSLAIILSDVLFVCTKIKHRNFTKMFLKNRLFLIILILFYYQVEFVNFLLQFANIVNKNKKYL